MRLAVLTDAFPVPTQTFVSEEVRALRALGHAVTVVTPDGRRGPPHPAPLDLLRRRQWARAEPVPPLRELGPLARRLRGADWVHVHFAAGAALAALRLRPGRYSLTVHGYDVFATPRNLRAKLAGAAFVTSGSSYVVERVRALAPGARVERIVMGVDLERWRRRSAPPSGEPLVLGVGRLVPKKGWDVLAEAARGLGARVAVIGDGPRPPRGLELLGPLPPEQVRAWMERATVLAAPCVIAPDGDRDNMPVVVKEAMALEVPVVASDVAGLPECVAPPWGRLVPPGDPGALRAALAGVLALPPDARAAAGAAGRAWVAEHADLHRETARLAALIADTRALRG